MKYFIKELEQTITWGEDQTIDSNYEEKTEWVSEWPTYPHDLLTLEEVGEAIEGYAWSDSDPSPHSWLTSKDSYQNPKTGAYTNTQKFPYRYVTDKTAPLGWRLIPLTKEDIERLLSGNTGEDCDYCGDPEDDCECFQGRASRGEFSDAGEGER